MDSATEASWRSGSGRIFPAPLLDAAYRIKLGDPLRVPDLVLNGIGFISEVLGRDLSPASLDPIATAFFVSVPSVIQGVRVLYAVTAKHVFKETAGIERATIITVNQRSGGVKPLAIVEGWHSHPDPTVDVAVIQIQFDPRDDIAVFDVEGFFDESRNKEGIGVGDEVFFPGLFTAAPGVERITPLVRHGNIAMLPSQQIQSDEGYVDLYLIEARSIGGLSGSPVFARETVALPVTRDDGESVRMQGIGVFKLLGMIQGHWDVDENKINQAYVSHDPKRGVNLGIAKVIPAKKILEALNGLGPKAMREALEAQHRKSHSSSMD